VLTRVPTTEFTFVLADEALRRPVWGGEAMARQLRRIVEIGRLSNVTIRLVATDANVRGGADVGEFVVLDFHERAGVGSLPTAAFADAPAHGFAAATPEETKALEGTFDELLSRSMDPEESLQLIDQAAQRLERRYLRTLSSQDVRPERRLTAVRGLGP
jgi:hypothetical protein